jgi:hypothetical protein
LESGGVLPRRFSFAALLRAPLVAAAVLQFRLLQNRWMPAQASSRFSFDVA